MGCDLHAVVYAKTWGTQYGAVLTFCEPRDYHVFAAMAGVRNYADPPVVPVAEPRGFPSWMGVIPGRESEHTEWLNGECDFGDHSFSWLTTDEFATALDRASAVPGRARGDDPAYGAVLAAMRHLDRPDGPAIIVFGFDN